MLSLKARAQSVLTLPPFLPQPVSYSMPPRGRGRGRAAFRARGRVRGRGVPTAEDAGGDADFEQSSAQEGSSSFAAAIRAVIGSRGQSAAGDDQWDEGEDSEPGRPFYAPFARPLKEDYARYAAAVAAEAGEAGGASSSTAPGSSLGRLRRQILTGSGGILPAPLPHPKLEDRGS